MLLVAFGAWVTSCAPFATSRLGWTTFDVGIIFTIFGVGDITLGPWLAHLADRTSRRRVGILATVPITAFGLALVLGLPRVVVYAVSFFTGSALTAFNASWFALLTEQVPAARRGRVLGILSAVGIVGTVVGALRRLRAVAIDRPRARPLPRQRGDGTRRRGPFLRSQAPADHDTGRGSSELVLVAPRAAWHPSCAS